MAAIIQICAWVSAAISLYKYWMTPLPKIWWVVLVLAVADMAYTSAAKSAYARGDESGIRLYGVIVLLVHLALIGIGVYALLH